MAFKQRNAPNMNQQNKQKYAYPSLFGSHASMVTEDKGDGKVVCTDEFGPYETEKNRLDNGRSDPNRYKTSRLTKLFSGAEKSKLEAAAKL